MKPPHIEHCRVLELGCTDGGNLIPMALQLPDSEFIGVDLASSRVAAGQEIIDQLGLKNIELRAVDLALVDAEWGEFDYIIAHGVYAWVPAAVRDAILRIAAKNLAPQGVAFVSYNAYPGGYLRRTFREMMLHHTDGIEDPRERIAKAKELMMFLDSSIDSKDGHYQAFVRREISEILERPANVLFHDELAEHWEPVFFHELIAHAQRHGLQFLAEADYWDMGDNGLRPEVVERLTSLIGDDRLAREQYRDFLKCRKFRRTLLCHERVSLDAKVKATRVQALYASSPASSLPVNSEEESARIRAFFSEAGAQMKTSHPLVIALISRLIESSPRSTHFEELLAEFGPENTEPISEILLSMYTAGLVDLAVWRPAFVSIAGERPEASPLARLQASRGSTMTTLNHATVEAEDDQVRRLVTLLDGTRNRAELMRDLLGSPPAGGERGTLDRELDRNLATVAKLALLIR